MDKRVRADQFRQRLEQAINHAGISRSELARFAGVDRSTVGQLLSGDDARLPNAQFAASAAEILGVSTDWLLSLTDRPERPGDVIAAAVAVTKAGRTSADEQLLEWHREAAGYKIRHVPATLPDMLKTEAVLQWEYEALLGRTPGQAISAMKDRMAWFREGGSDYEIAVAEHELAAFAQGAGYYAGLSHSARGGQLEHLADVCEEMFPSLRLFLFDARRQFSAPMTVFGPLLSVIYVGRFYLAFRSSDRIRSMTSHFDWLVREAVVDAREIPAWLRKLARSVPSRS